MPLLLIGDGDSDDSLLMMVLMNSMTGGLKSQSGFDSNFNMILPLLLKDCADTDADCKKKQKNIGKYCCVFLAVSLWVPLISYIPLWPPGAPNNPARNMSAIVCPPGDWGLERLDR